MINKFNPGVNTSFSTKLNNNFCISLRNSLLNLQRALQNGTVEFSEGTQDAFGEAYIDATGRMNSVNTDETITTAAFSSNKYIYVPYAKTSTTESYANTSTITGHNNTLTVSVVIGSTKCILSQIGFYTYSSGSDTFTVTVKNNAESETIASWSGSMVASSWHSKTFNLSEYSRVLQNETVKIIFSSGSSMFQYYNSGSLTGTYMSISGVVPYSDSTSHKNIILTVVNDVTENYIEHAISTGRFPANVSSFVANNIIADWETGADIQMKLTNASEDSGYFSIVKMTTPAVFTEFTSEPTKVIIKLIPKSSNPTAGYPSIYSIGVYAE